jgi:hypothetical protein
MEAYPVQLMAPEGSVPFTALNPRCALLPVTVASSLSCSTFPESLPQIPSALLSMMTLALTLANPVGGVARERMPGCSVT